MKIYSPKIRPLADVSGSLVITGSTIVTGDILPAGGGQYLGSLSQPWEEIFVTTGSINFINDGEVVKTLTAQTVVTTETLAQTLPAGIVSSSNQIDEFLVMAVSDEITALTTGSAKLTFRAPFDMNLYQIPRASLTSGSTSGNIVVDINSGSVSILGGTKLTVDQGEKTSKTSSSQTTLASTLFTDDAEITIDIDSAGTSATGLKVTLYYRKG